MATWQFWTLIGVLAAFGIYVVTTLSAIYDRLDHANRFFVMLHDDLRKTVGTLADISNSVEAIKHRAQRD